MTNPGTILDDLITALRAISGLVTEVGGDAARIYAYHDKFPVYSDVIKAQTEQREGSIMAAYMGSAPGDTRGAWRHTYQLYIRSSRDSTDDSPYCRILELLANGIPSTQTRCLLEQSPNANVEPMEFQAYQRVPGDTDRDADHFEASVSFAELWG